MHNLIEFEETIKQRLAAAHARRRQSQQSMAHEMAEHQRRSQRFEQVSRQLMKSVIRPYMVSLARLFPNAHLSNGGDTSASRHCTCRFDHAPEYPASTTLDFALSPDASLTRVVVTYTLEILPLFLQFEGRDQVTMPVGSRR
jgi:hypothetical protein